VHRRAVLWVLHMKYEVQTHTWCDGWINTWTDDDTPVIFDTHAAALDELTDFLRELAYAVKAGHLDDYNPDDYRIVEVAI
jgi:hypothetical protein